jgi:hypothetical protein
MSKKTLTINGYRDLAEAIIEHNLNVHQIDVILSKFKPRTIILDKNKKPKEISNILWQWGNHPTDIPLFLDLDISLKN